MRCIILPEGNKRDYDDLPEFIREGMEVHFVSNYHQIYDIIFQYKETNIIHFKKLTIKSIILKVRVILINVQNNNNKSLC